MSSTNVNITSENAFSTFKNIHWKDVLIGISTAYIGMDLLLMYTMQRDHPGVIGSFLGENYNENGVTVLVIGAIIGFLTYYLSSRAREYFTVGKDE